VPAHPQPSPKVGSAAFPPRTALAPMQDVTDHAFMHLIARYGAPEAYVTEYLRVHAHATVERSILKSIVENTTGRPVYAQLIGEHIPDLVRIATELLRYPVAGIDLNLGCPAPKVYKKNVGGGLLRDPPRVDRILAALRDAIPGRFTVKMRIGFDSPAPFDELLASVARHRVDLLTVHGRTVRHMYRPGVRYDLIAHAVRSVPCPVLANGDVTSSASAARILAETGAAGVMVGRHAIRNPWIFRQISAQLDGQPVFAPTLGDVRAYIDDLYHTLATPGIPERSHINRLKKFLNFVGAGVDPQGAFLKAMRHTQSATELFAVADTHLAAPDRAALPFSPEPYPGAISRPNAGEGCSLGDD